MQNEKFPNTSFQRHLYAIHKIPARNPQGVLPEVSWTSLGLWGWKSEMTDDV